MGKKKYWPVSVNLKPPSGWEWWRSENGFHLRHLATQQLTWAAPQPTGCYALASQWKKYWAENGGPRPPHGDLWSAWPGRRDQVQYTTTGVDE